MKAYMVLADGFEEIEGLTATDLLRRAGVEVVMVSIMKRLMVTGGHNIRVEADTLYEEAVAATNEFSDGDMLILPGGKAGAECMAAHEGVCNLLHAYDKANKYIAAICAAPSVPGRLGLLKGKRATCYPGFEDRVLGAEMIDASVVQDSKYITGRGMGVSTEFALKLVEVLTSPETAEKLARTIQKP